VVNLTKKQFDEYNKNSNFRIVLPLEYDIDELEDEDAPGVLRQPMEIKQLSQNFGDVEEGEPLCLFNFEGYMVIAVRGGNASDKFKLKPLFAQDLKYLRVAIRFDQ
jgi:S-adenosylmethionine hydrolase